MSRSINVWGRIEVEPAGERCQVMAYASAVFSPMKCTWQCGIHATEIGEGTAVLKNNAFAGFD